MMMMMMAKEDNAKTTTAQLKWPFHMFKHFFAAYYDLKD